MNFSLLLFLISIVSINAAHLKGTFTLRLSTASSDSKDIFVWPDGHLGDEGSDIFVGRVLEDTSVQYVKDATKFIKVAANGMFMLSTEPTMGFYLNDTSAGAGTTVIFNYNAGGNGSFSLSDSGVLMFGHSIENAGTVYAILQEPVVPPSSTSSIPMLISSSMPLSSSSSMESSTQMTSSMPPTVSAFENQGTMVINCISLMLLNMFGLLAY